MQYLTIIILSVWSCAAVGAESKSGFDEEFFFRWTTDKYMPILLDPNASDDDKKKSLLFNDDYQKEYIEKYQDYLRHLTKDSLKTPHKMRAKKWIRKMIQQQ